MTKIWTDKEIVFLQNNYNIKGIKACANDLSRSDSSVAKKAGRLGLKAPGGGLKTTAQYDIDLFNKEIDINYLEDYKGANISILHECIEGHIFKARPSNVLSGMGCPICSNRFTRTSKQYSNQISFKILEDYIDTRTPILHQCTNNHIWKAPPSNILRGTGCPSCSQSGFNNNKPAILYYIKITKNDYTYYKIGITNRTVKDRFINDSDKIIISLREIHYEIGQQAKEEEKRLLKKYKSHRQYIPDFLKSGGNTELFKFDVLGLDYNGNI